MEDITGRATLSKYANQIFLSFPVVSFFVCAIDVACNEIWQTMYASKALLMNCANTLYL
jgi:hypothetical protein